MFEKHSMFVIYELFQYSYLSWQAQKLWALIQLTLKEQLELALKLLLLSLRLFDKWY